MNTIFISKPEYYIYMDWTARALSHVEFDDNVLMDEQAEQISHKMAIMNYAIDAKKMLLVFF